MSQRLLTGKDFDHAARPLAAHEGPVVVCLCAEWCGTCRTYQADFADLASRYADFAFVWLDVEDDAELAGDLDIETFPTIMVLRDHALLFGGVLLPHIQHLDRLLGTLDDRRALPDNEFSAVARRLLDAPLR